MSTDHQPPPSPLEYIQRRHQRGTVTFRLVDKNHTTYTLRLTDRSVIRDNGTVTNVQLTKAPSTLIERLKMDQRLITVVFVYLQGHHHLDIGSIWRTHALATCNGRDIR